MRLEDLYLDGFGHFHRHAIGPISGPVTVFYGPNEAGKSTLLAFIRAVLFGFPSQFNKHYPPLSGGRHGGRITLYDRDGVKYSVERFAGARGGLKIVAPDGPVVNPEVALQRLTGNATLDLFRNVFAFSLDELQAAASLNDANDSIYSIGQGAPSLPAMRRRFSDQKSTIYRPRGTNQEVPKLLNALQQVDEQLRAVAGNAGRYGELTARKAEIDAELVEADALLSQIAASRAKIGNLRNGWELWVELSGCETQLQDLPRFERFPENPVPRLDGIEERLRQAREDRDEEATRLSQAEIAATAEIPDEALIQDQNSIETIRRARGGFDGYVADLPKRQAALDALENDFHSLVSDLGPDWDETKLQGFDTSIAFRQEVENGKAALTERQDAVRRAEQRLDQEQSALSACQFAVREAQEKMPASLPPLDAADLSKQRAALRATRQRLDEYERARQNHENLRGQLSLIAKPEPAAPAGRSPLWLPALLLVTGVLLTAVGAMLGNASLTMGLVAGLGLIGAAGYLLWRGRAIPAAAHHPLAASVAQQSAEAESSAQSAWQRLTEYAAPLSLGGDPTAAALDSAEERLGAAQAELSAWDDAQTQAGDAQRRLEAQETKKDSAAQRLEDAANDYHLTQQKWQEWLQHQGLPTGFTPDTMSEFMGKADTCRAVWSQVIDHRHQVAGIEDSIEQFRKQVAPLAARHGIAPDYAAAPDAPASNDYQPAAAADELIRRLDEIQTLYSRREQAAAQAQEIRQSLENREQRVTTVEREHGELLAAGGTDDAEEFRRRARLELARQELEERREAYRRGLELLSGPGDRLEAFRQALANSDLNGLEAESARLSEQNGNLESRRDELREERGGIDAELARLTGEEESSALRIRRHALAEQLSQCAGQWSRFTIAETLLEKTRQKFEQERQPSVIRHAQDFFAEVTGQHYRRLFAPIGEQTITVTDANDTARQPDQLSRGTREQLYLALRFGLIREFGEHAAPLPVVVDDALVNFDPDRAELAARAFAQLSQTNQVLVFTCHPNIAQMFADTAGAQVMEISR